MQTNEEHRKALVELRERRKRKILENASLRMEKLKGHCKQTQESVLIDQNITTTSDTCATENVSVFSGLRDDALERSRPEEHVIALVHCSTGEDTPRTSTATDKNNNNLRGTEHVTALVHCSTRTGEDTSKTSTDKNDNNLRGTEPCKDEKLAMIGRQGLGQRTMTMFSVVAFSRLRTAILVIFAVTLSFLNSSLAVLESYITYFVLLEFVLLMLTGVYVTMSQVQPEEQLPSLGMILSTVAFLQPAWAMPILLIVFTTGRILIELCVFLFVIFVCSAFACVYR